MNILHPLLYWRKRVYPVLGALVLLFCFTTLHTATQDIRVEAPTDMCITFSAHSWLVHLLVQYCRVQPGVTSIMLTNHKSGHYGLFPCEQFINRFALPNLLLSKVKTWASLSDIIRKKMWMMQQTLTRVERTGTALVLGCTLVSWAQVAGSIPRLGRQQCWGDEYYSHALSSARNIKPWALCVDISLHIEEPLRGQNYPQFYLTVSLIAILAFLTLTPSLSTPDRKSVV